MSKESYTSKEIDQLALMASEGELNVEQTERLHDMIMNYPKARRRIARCFYLQSYFKDELESLELDSVQPVRINQMVWLAAAAVILVGLFVVWFTWPDADQDANKVVNRISDNEEKGVAVIHRHVGVVWGSETTLQESNRVLGVPLKPCLLEIKEGVLQIDFYHGATVLLEGPAKFEVVNAWQGRLIHGKISAEVLSPALGFEILSDGFRVVDLGTSFAMKVDRDGTGEVHVFDGEVEIWRPNVKKQMLLKQGESVSIQDNTIVVGKAQPQAFTRSESLDRNVELKIAKANEMRKQLTEDEGVVLYYSFSTAGEWVRYVENEAKHGAKDTDGAVVGCHSTQGRWPGTQALGFDSSSDRVRLNIPDEFKDVSMMVWVKIYTVLGDSVALLNPETEQDRFVHWNVIYSNTNKTKQLHFSDTDRSEGLIKGRAHYHCFTNVRKQLGESKWAHLALVYDSKAREVRHYVNGEMIGVNEIKNVRPMQVGIADLGNWPQKEWAKGTEFEIRNLIGAMCEFLLAKRVFTEFEIKKIYEAGKP
jgi:hypothetical protein